MIMTSRRIWLIDGGAGGSAFVMGMLVDDVGLEIDTVCALHSCTLSEDVDSERSKQLILLKPSIVVYCGCFCRQYLFFFSFIISCSPT